MRNYMLQAQFNNTREITSLERKTQKTEEDLEDVKGAIQRDFQTLQGQIEDLQMASKQQRDDFLALKSSSNRSLQPRGQVTSFDPNDIAEMYLDEAENLEQTAAKLRQQAIQMSNSGVSRKLVTMKLLEAPKMSKDGSQINTEHRCCGEVFDSVQDMLKHVNSSHGVESKVDQHEDLGGISGDTTPTHAPPRRMKPKDATEIKAPKPEEENYSKPEPIEPVKDLSKPEAAEVKKEDEDKEPTPNIAATEAEVTPLEPNIEKWTPLAVSQMPKPAPLDVESNTETFTWEFLKNTLHGEQWSPGFYYASSGDCPLKSKAYWVLEGDYEPYIPTAPGEHGAKLTAFFNNTIPKPGEGPNEENFHDTPVFIRQPGKNEYVYFGHYSQKRFSDKLDHDTVNERVPEKVRKYWAEQLSETGRPRWVTNELVQHFWPKPAYDGPIPTDSTINTPATGATEDTNSSAVLEKRVKNALEGYAYELKDWSKETEMKVKRLTADNLMEAFSSADCAEEPGLRLWWEYMTFQHYEQGFYDFLVNVKDFKKTGKINTPAIPKKQVDLGGKIAKPTEEDEIVVPESPPKLHKSKASASTPTWKPAPMPKKHTGGGKPWEQATLTSKGEKTLHPNGDLEAAKAIQADLKKNYAQGGGRGGNGRTLPPHLRGRQ